MITVVGARVRRVDRPTPELVTIEVSAGVRAVVLVSVSPAKPGIGLVDARPRGRPIDAFGSLLRKHLESSVIVAIEAGHEGVRIVFLGEHGARVLEATHGREGRGYRLLHEDGTRLGQSAHTLPPLPDQPPVDDGDLVANGPLLLAANASAAFEARRKAAKVAVGRAIDKMQRKLAAIRRDAARSETATLMRHEADLLSAYATDDRAGRTELVVDDWTDSPPTPRTIALDSKLGPRTAAARRYHQAKRLERGMRIAEERAADVERELEPLLVLEGRVASAANDSDLDPIEDALDLRGTPALKPGADKHEQATHCPYREFESARGVAIRVGKNAADNDELTVRIARPHHLFLHVRGVSGSHVIVVLAKNVVCDEATLVDAATLAAHFSGSRGEPTVEVQYVARRHVRKRRGSARGAVEVDREKVMLLRVEPERVRRVLASERKPRPT